ncbi:ABC transporter substrate-binding protein [Stomatohabitans albus]|uniref:peptide ABC transporter substrate-binding protein n=1 Tax=Stomatohabitans albus TaxID=3110766 RepID=UPI00300C76EA
MPQFHKAPALLISLALLAAGCSGGSTTTSSESAMAGGGSGGSGKTIAMHACEPQHLVPSNTADSCGSEILSQLFTPLVRIGSDLKPSFGADNPDTVAETITANDDNSVWTIKLKDGWTFHNGEKVDADAYLRAWNYAVDPKNAQKATNFFEHIKGYQSVVDGTSTELEGLKAVDPMTLEITLESPFAPFITMLSYNAFFPLPKAAMDDINGYNEAPIGNGPFKMDGTWQHNQQINVVRYEDYPGTQADMDAIEHRIYEDYGTAYNDLRAGNIDILEDLPVEQVASYEADLGDRVYENPTSNFGFLSLPVNDDKFKDPKIRKALSMAIDREAIIKAVFNDTRTPADDFVSPLVDGYRKGGCTSCDYNPEEAKKLYDEAGGIQGPIEVWFNSGAGHEEWIEAVANNWKQNLGVEDVKFQSMIFADYLSKLEEHTVTGPYRMAWLADYPSMENYLSSLLGKDGASNYGSYDNPRVDDLIKQGNQAKTLEESVKLYQQADDIINEDMPMIPILYSTKFSGTGERISNFSLDFGDHVEILKLKVAE